MSKPYLSPLPATLKRPLKADAFSEGRESVFQALVDRYRLSKEHLEMLREANNSPHENVAGTVFWRGLAKALMHDFIPAYQPKLSKADKHILLDWMDAGGGVSHFFSDPRFRRHFYQAQLVWLLQWQKTQKNRSLAWVFRWFSNEEDTQGPKEKTRRTALLPRPYRRRLTSLSLKQAFNSIPRFVRERPDQYLPFVGLGPAAAKLQ